MSKALRLAFLAFAALPLSASALCFGDHCGGWSSPDALKSEVTELMIVSKAMESGNVPGDWAAVGFVSTASIRQLTRALEGVSVDVPSIGAALTLSRAELLPDVGRTKVAFVIDAKHKATGLAVGLAVETYLQYHHIARSGPEERLETVLRFGAASIKPVASWGVMRSSTSDFAARLIGAGAVKAFAERLQVTIPYSIDLPLTIGIEKNKQGQHKEIMHLPDTPVSTWRVEAEVEMIESDIGPTFKTLVAVPSSDGLWLLAGLNDIGRSSLSANGSANELTKQRDRLRDKVAGQLKALPAQKNGFAVWVSKSVFSAVADNYNALPQSAKVIRLKTIKAEGSLVEAEDKIAGQKGGYRVSFRGNDAASATINLGTASASWEPKEGLSITAAANATATAALDVFVDPYIGGGVTTKATLRGKTAPYLHQERVSFEKMGTKQGEVLIAGAVSNCREVEYELTTGGEVEIGARMYVHLRKDAGSPTLIADPLPRYENLLRTLGVSESDLLDMRPTWIERRVSIAEFRTDSKGYFFSGSATFARVANVPSEAESDAAKKSLEDEVEAYWDKKHPACGPTSATKILFAGQDFGPNNEIVKAVKRIADAVSRQVELQKHNFEVAEEDLKKVVQDPREAPKVAGEIVKRGARELAKVPGKVVNEVQRFAKKMKKKLRL
jgi:hypothetical protein